MSWSSGTNTIKEGGEAKNLTLQMLEVPKQSGGTELFVRKSDVTLGTKSISQNGTYTAASDGKYGFSQVTVNVRGGNGSADSSGKPSTSPNAPKPGGSGSAVVGTDPTTGNDQVVGVDESGNLVTTPLPRSIVLVTPPTKTTYQDGESIDLTGAVVVAKNADGTTWTDADHPNGHVSCTPEPTTADVSAKTESVASSELFPDAGAIPYAEIPIGEMEQDVKDYKIDLVSAEDTVYGFSRVHEGGGLPYLPLMVSKKPFAIKVYAWDHYYILGGWRDVTDAFSQIYASTTVQGKPIYEASANLFGSIGKYPLPHLKTSVHYSILGYIILYGTTVGGGQSVALKWARPADGKELSTTMQIKVTGSSQTTESSSGTSGSGGGGSF